MSDRWDDYVQTYLTSQLLLKMTTEVKKTSSPACRILLCRVLLWHFLAVHTAPGCLFVRTVFIFLLLSLRQVSQLTVLAMTASTFREYTLKTQRENIIIREEASRLLQQVLTHISFCSSLSVGVHL